MSKTPITSGVVARRYQVQRRRWYNAFTVYFRGMQRLVLSSL